MRLPRLPLPTSRLAPRLREVPDSLYYRGPSSGPVRIEYSGTAGFTVSTPDRVLVIDPFVTRPGLLALATQPLLPDDVLIEQVFPHADDVLIGHAHYDHVLDAPSVCNRTGARFIGSRSACNVARAAGVAEDRIVQVSGGDEITCGDHVLVRAIHAAHGRVYGVVPLQGTIDAPPAWPPRNRALRCGEVFNWHLHIDRDGDAPLRVLHVDSAEFFADELRGTKADVLCLCAIGRNYRPRYLEEIVEITEPKAIIPCHWDWLFDPLHRAPRQLPGVDLEGFVESIAALDVEPIVLPFRGVYAP